MRPPPISHKQLAAAGWNRTDARPWTKCAARFAHFAGWTLAHCGHPTALRPWILEDPKGRLVLTGVRGPDRRPDFGTAWSSLAEPVEWLGTLDRNELENGLRSFERFAPRTLEPVNPSTPHPKELPTVKPPKLKRPQPRQVVPIRFRDDELALLLREARRRDVPTSTLARQFVVEAAKRAERRARTAKSARA